MPEDPKQGAFSGWAVVEVMGHATHIGYVETVNFGAASLFRVDSPEMPEREYALTRPEWVNAEYLPIGSKVKREARKPHSVFVGAASIYRLTPCDEAAAREATERNEPRKIIIVERAAKAALPAAVDEAIAFGDDREDIDPDRDEDVPY